MLVAYGFVFSFANARAAASDGVQMGAEFAMRWDPKEGGPRSAKQVLKTLGLASSDKDEYEIRYFIATKPVESPQGFDPILRERVKKKKAELTFKLRGKQPLQSVPSLRDWQCPLGATQDRKDEVDVSFISPKETKKVFSRSCTVEMQRATARFPDSLGAEPKGCKNTMTRVKANGLKVEEWRLSDGSSFLEVSKNGANQAADERRFRAQVVEPMLKAGVKPVDRSKSELGSECP